MTGLSSTDKRKRALRIRALAIGFNDQTSRTMVEMAEELEAEAAREKVAQRNGDGGPENSKNQGPDASNADDFNPS